MSVWWKTSAAAFHRGILSGFASPFESCSVRVGRGVFEQGAGDKTPSFHRTLDPGGGETLVFVDDARSARFFWGGWRTLSADEAASNARQRSHLCPASEGTPMSETPPTEAAPIPPEWADPRGAGASYGEVYWPPAPSPEIGWRTASAPPAAGRRDAVLVTSRFTAPAGELFWTLFEPDWMERDGWESGRPDEVDRIRMVLCRHAAGAPDAAHPDDMSGWRTIEVDILASLSLADIAALPPDDEGDWFPHWLKGGWEFPWQDSPARSEAIGAYEWITGDYRWLVCTRTPSGPEVLLTGDVGHGCSVTRRRLEPDEIVLLRDGVDPKRRDSAAGSRTILAEE